jgi:hypothetical protein
VSCKHDEKSVLAEDAYSVKHVDAKMLTVRNRYINVEFSGQRYSFYSIHIYHSHNFAHQTLHSSKIFKNQPTLRQTIFAMKLIISSFVLAITMAVKADSITHKYDGWQNCVDPGEHQCALLIQAEENYGNSVNIIGGTCNSNIMTRDSTLNGDNAGGWYGKMHTTYGADMDLWVKSVRHTQLTNILDMPK